MVSYYILGDSPEPVDAFSSLGWIGANAAPGFVPYSNPDPVFIVFWSCLEAVAHHSNHIGHKIVHSLRRRCSAFLGRRRGRIGQPGHSSAISLTDSSLAHSPEIFIVDLMAPPSYEAALMMSKPHRTTEGFSVYDQTQRCQGHGQGHPPKYSMVEPTKEKDTTELGPPPSYEQVISNSVIDINEFLC